jgi:hypothetical protein
MYRFTGRLVAQSDHENTANVSNQHRSALPASHKNLSKEFEMTKNRLMKLIVGTIIILAAALAVQAFEPSDGAPESNQPYVGMGDLRRIEAQDSRAAEWISANVGMGELRRFEARQVNVSTGATTSSHPVVGMGDLHRFEAQQLLPISVSNRSSTP